MSRNLCTTSTFNDEPGPRDGAKFQVTRRRGPLDGVARGPISFDHVEQGAYIHVRVRCDKPGQRALLGTLVCSAEDFEALSAVLSAEVIP